MATKLMRSLSSDSMLPRFLSPRSLSPEGRPNNANTAASRRNLMRTMSTENMMDAGSRGVHKVSKRTLNVFDGVVEAARNLETGIEMGVTGVAQGMAQGLEGAAQMATQLTRSKVSTARKRQSEFNVFGDGDLVSVDFLLQNIKAAEKNKDVTKLELEDLVYGKNDCRDPVIYKAVSSLLKNDGDRSWKFIKFIDSLRVGLFGTALEGLQQYEKKRQALWDHIKEDAVHKPIMFQLKLEFEEDTPAAKITTIFNQLLELNLTRIEYLGGLHGYKPPEIGDALADLCKPEDPEDDIQDSGLLTEMIQLTIHYAAGDSDTTIPRGDKVWQKVLRRCIRRLGGTTVGGLGDSSHSAGSRRRSRSRSGSVGSMGDSDHSAKPRVSRAGRASDPNLMREAIKKNRAMSPRRSPPTPKPPTLRRAATDGHADIPLSMGGPSSSHHKRSKPRAFGQPIQGWDLDNSDNSFADENPGERQSFAACDSDKQWGDRNGQSHGEERVDATLSVAHRRRNGVVRSSSSPMQKREPLVPMEPVREVKRSTSLKKKSRPIISEDEDGSKPADSEIKEAKQTSSVKKKSSPRSSPRTSPSRKDRPSYDWSKHSSHHEREGGGDMDWSKHAATASATSSTEGMDDSEGVTAAVCA